jgi:hypothetical protein
MAWNGNQKVHSSGAVADVEQAPAGLWCYIIRKTNAPAYKAADRDFDTDADARDAVDAFLLERHGAVD